MREPDVGIVPRFSVDRAPWQPYPEFGGSKAVLYRSPDGRRVLSTVRESGRFQFEYPFDEAVYVIAGTASVQVVGGEAFVLNPGDLAYFRTGQIVDFDLSHDFQDIACLMFDGQNPGF